ncbi:WXG100 family type VII secretion target [Saccharopolyspora gloriosae]|uniref:PPE domain-containing protein n=1 Tax=Saccharopolyspora gloriosae TaxID=455344 RepID=A0A840N6Q2_9PSEU|nr:PPE domain-containing protein [Saccharopolyspora gloriosae]MBB5067726.1 hypothetical protein [Saccharopolyspora gloriosae]
MTQEEQSTAEPMRARSATLVAGSDLVLRDTQNWSSRSHRELYEAVHQGNEPGRVGELAQDWARMGAEIGESSERMAERLRGTEEGWQGEAAKSARGAIHELARWTSDAGQTAGDLGQRIGEQGRVMEDAKTNMPEPKDVEFRDEIVSLYGVLGGGSGKSVLAGLLAATEDMKEQAVKADSAHDEAVAVMERMEISSRVVDGSTPRFEPPPDPIRDEQKQGVKATLSQPREPLSANPQVTDSAGAPSPGEVPGAQQPGGPPPGGAEETKRMPVLNTPASNVPASNAPASAPHLESTPQLHGDKGGPQGGPGARVPSLDGFGGGDGKNQGRRPLDRKTGPDGTSPQGSRPSGTKPSNVDPPTIKHRPLPPLPGTDTGGGGPVAPGGRVPTGPGRPGGGNGPGPNGRSGWSGAIPPIPGTSGPGGAGGGLGAGGSGGSSGPGGSSGSGGSNVGAGGRSSVSMGPGGGPAGGPVGGGSASGSGSAGAGAGGMGAPGAAAGRGRGGEDEERRAKYVESTPIVEVPGADLPPPVIGGGKPKKKDS